MNVGSQAIGDPDSLRAYQIAHGQAGDLAYKVDPRTGGVPGNGPYKPEGYRLLRGGGQQGGI